MYCPKCRAEYRPDFNRCADCDVGLVHELPEEPIPEFVAYEELIFTYNPGDSALLKSLLDGEGIQYYIQGETFAPYYYHALPMRFFVRKGQLSEAREIIKDLDLRITSYSTDNLENKKEDED
jgi:hypothetical protein